MNKTELIKELREITQAGMKDCHDALQEADFDLEKAIDIIKTKGKNIVSGRSGKIASEGMVAIAPFNQRGFALVEVNCQTDFVSNSPDFKLFANNVAASIVNATNSNMAFDTSTVESARAELVARTKENIVIRRWWVEEAINLNSVVVNYIHNNKIGVLLTVFVEHVSMLSNPECSKFIEQLAMQIAAMNPIAVSSDTLPSEVVARQQAIFETQLREANKPESVWPKILEGKFNKWYNEVCLLNQDSIIFDKKTVKQSLEMSQASFGGEIKIVNFIRCQVGEGIDKPQEEFANEVAKLV